MLACLFLAFTFAFFLPFLFTPGNFFYLYFAFFFFLPFVYLFYVFFLPFFLPFFHLFSTFFSAFSASRPENAWKFKKTSVPLQKGRKKAKKGKQKVKKR